jgi:hypothetical protein
VVIAIVAIGLVLALGWWALSRARRSAAPTPPSPAPDGESVVDPADLADLDARFGGVELLDAGRRHALLEAHLRPVVQRRVPVRTIEPVPGLHISRLRFADGTAIVVRGFAPGDVGILASVIRKHSVLPGACATDARGTHVDFDWSGGRRTMSLLVTGLDQPD